MIKELQIFTGKLNYNNDDYEFVFDGKELKLILLNENREKIEEEFAMKEIVRGFSIDKISVMKEKYLIGKCYENNKTIIFLTQQNAHIMSSNSILSIKLVGYIISNELEMNDIDRMTFKCPEISCIYSRNQAYQFSLDNKIAKNGVFSLKTIDFDLTSTEKQSFLVDDKNIQIQFSISRGISKQIDESPISINSIMIFEFDKTRDYDFILKLWYIAKEFLQFLCYRKDIYLPMVDLSMPYEGEEGKHQKIATLYILNELDSTDFDTLKKGRYISQKYIEGLEGKILTDIANGSLYLRHIPETYKAGRLINASRFIMITAAFEWEFKRTYPDGVPKTASEIEVVNKAKSALDNLISESTGNLKRKYKFLRKLIDSDSLQKEIIKIGKDFDDIIGGFGTALYKTNNNELVYKDMGERLASQRNNFAHGNLNKDFIGTSLLDLMYMEYIIYAMQLKYYGVNNVNIRKSINELFNLHFCIE